ncbi:MAG TPA: HAMP domain-containing sensor histidine kinase [bacterium]|nr:HAMP domain-containing sensor histidine kinase [bacterium]
MTGEASRNPAGKETVWVRTPLGGSSDTLATREIELSRATSDEVLRIARFAHVMLHELRTPLTGALTSLGMLRDLARPTDDPQRARCVENAMRCVRLMVARTDDAQDIVLFRTGLTELTVRTFDVGDLLRKVTGDFEETAAQASVKVRITVEEGLPALRADERRVERVLRHVLDNVFEYAPSGRGVDVRACARNGRIVLEVQDYGPGMDPGRKMGILQHNYRDELQFGEVAGMGIGLEYCKIVLEQHGGRITVTTAPNKGTLVTAEFPLAN